MVYSFHTDNPRNERRKPMMKKILSLALALCLVLALIPALGEEDASGTWYLVALGMTAGTLELNADGSAVLTTTSNGETVTEEAAWTQEGATVTLSALGKSLALTLDGTDLLISPESFGAVGMDLSGIDLSGIDLSLFTTMMKFSREAGAVTSEEFNAWQADGTLPEGKTAEDMNAIQENMMSLYSSLFGSFSFSSEDSQEAAPPVTVLEENFYVRKNYDTMEGYYLARVQNDTDAPLSLYEGSLTLKDADGNEIGKSEWISECGSRYLEPGEITYVAMNADIAEGAEVASWEPVLATTLNTWSSDITIPVDGVELKLDMDYSNYAAATVTNTGDTPLHYINVISAVRDESGKLYALCSGGLGHVDLMPGSTVVIWQDIDSRTIEYCQENQVKLTSVEAFGWADPQ